MLAVAGDLREEIRRETPPCGTRCVGIVGASRVSTLYCTVGLLLCVHGSSRETTVSSCQSCAWICPSMARSVPPAGSATELCAGASSRSRP